MAEIFIDFQKTVGPIKPMHAVNNGPVSARSDQPRGNFESYKAVGFPFARNHDASFNSEYGGEHTVDVGAVFPNFDADPEDPASYDFVYTDDYIARTLAAGTETFYRLGSKIEHGIKKYGTLPPKDPKKWAVICEHMIRHFNEGWAEGYHFGIRYFEIWNEPDLSDGDPADKKTWGGTTEEFFDFYEVAAKHLKACFPTLKIGGPAIATNLAWGERFLSEMSRRGVPLDFFSWHCYTREGVRAAEKARAVRALLDRYGYESTESILNEWNYIKNWSDRFLYSIQQIISMKGAAFSADVMCRCQHEDVDMLMYYDARICAFNGLWEYYTIRPLPGYYPFLMFSKLYCLGTAVETPSEIDGVSLVAARGTSGEGGIMLTYYTDDDDLTEEKTVTLHFSGITLGALSLTILDREHENERVSLPLADRVEVTMKPNSVVYVSLEV